MKALQNKQVIIAIVVAVILVLGVGGVFVLSQSKNQNPGTTSTVAEEDTNQEATSSSTTQNIVEIIKNGKSMQCNFNYADDNSSTAGVFYVNGTNMRGDITTRVDEKGEETDFFMVRKGDESYIWGSAFPKDTGIKMTVPMEEFVENDQTSKYFSDERANYDCKPWEVDQTAFEIPTTVKFQDFSQMMQSLQR